MLKPEDRALPPFYVYVSINTLSLLELKNIIMKGFIFPTLMLLIVRDSKQSIGFIMLVITIMLKRRKITFHSIPISMEVKAHSWGKDPNDDQQCGTKNGKDGLAYFII